MTSLKDKIQNALDENRMLVLGAEVLIGFEFTAFFQDGFKSLSGRSQILNLVGLALMLFALVLLLSPGVFHQLVERGQDTLDVHRFTTTVIEVALLPFALGLGTTVYITAEHIDGVTTGIIFGLAATFIAGLLWYGPRFLPRVSRTARSEGNSVKRGRESQKHGETSIHDKIRQVLTEARVIIPGNQALMGFQFAVILQKGFNDLPMWAKWLHLSSLSLISLSTVLLLTPAAYHRIVEQGEETQAFFRVASALVLSSLPPLALGLCLDFFIVIYRLSGSLTMALVAAAVLLILSFGMWFGYPWFRRNHLRTLVGAEI
jgi:hypothetical protein